jgi:hypothetical protein
MTAKKEKSKPTPAELLAWDPDYVKLTDEERERLKQSEAEMENGEYITEEDFWA